MTSVLEHNRPTPVHKVHPPHVVGPFSEYLPCAVQQTEAEWLEAELLKARAAYLAAKPPLPLDIPDRQKGTE